MLKDVTLTAIVRDEEMNPAHGIALWLESTLPFVEKAVVIDTGSVDKTKELLYAACQRFPHLQVQERRFDDYMSARNHSLALVKTPRALILDADELITPEEYGRLATYIAERPDVESFDFTFKEIYPCGAVLNTMANVQIARIIDPKKASFVKSQDGVFEDTSLCEKVVFVPQEIATIKHFMPDDDALKRKQESWYYNRTWKHMQPYCHAKIFGWKEPSGARFVYKQTEAYRKACCAGLDF